ncbi:MAG TPA: hypothetical protein VL092_08725 [Chitinophagaceae bacterium]|nr:hypothetical protein [Chitinophagaceae bacterium]
MGQSPTLSYPVSAQNLTRAYSRGLLTVKLVFNGICSGTNTVRVSFPSSVTYVPGTITKTSGTAGVTIAESSIANLSRPEFNISGVSAVADEITFSVARRAGCGELASVKDTVYFISGAGCSDVSDIAGSVNSYNILSPALSLTPPPTLTGAVIGTTVTRTSKITNGGTGATDTVRFYIVYSGGGIVNSSGTNAIMANGTSFTPSSINGDTLFYKFFGAAVFGGDNKLDNSETVTVEEPIRVIKCNTNTIYSSAWGKYESVICEQTVASSVLKGSLQYNTDNKIELGGVAAGAYLVRVIGSEIVHTRQIRIGIQ